MDVEEEGWEVSDATQISGLNIWNNIGVIYSDK